MDIELTSEQLDFVRHALAGGRITTSEQAIHEALELWMERERRRSDLLASLDAAEASLARGEGITLTESAMRTLADDVLIRCRARLAGGSSAAR